MSFTITNMPEAASKLLRLSGEGNPQVALASSEQLAKALTLPLRQAVLSGDIVSDIYSPLSFPPGTHIEYPLDFLTPGLEDELVAYTIPSPGRIPEKHIEGDYIAISTFRIAGSIDWDLKYARDARWDIVGRAMQALQVQFTKKTNDDGWHTLLAAGVDRNILVYDANAQNGQFTKRLVSLMKLIMRRNGGGNSSSTNRSVLTDLYFSPEGMEDIRNWQVDQVDEVTRREIFLAGDNAMSRIFQVNLHVIDELGADQEYQLYYTNQLSGTLPSGDVEIVVGLNKNRATFIRAMRDPLEIFPDPAMHRFQRAGYYGWLEHGFAILDNRDIILGSF